MQYSYHIYNPNNTLYIFDEWNYMTKQKSELPVPFIVCKSRLPGTELKLNK